MENENAVQPTTAPSPPVDVEKLKLEALTLYNSSRNLFDKVEPLSQKLGEVLVQIKAILPTGKYTKWLEETKIDRNRANYAVRCFEGKIAPKKKIAKPKPGEQGDDTPMELLPLDTKTLSVKIPVFTYKVLSYVAGLAGKEPADIVIEYIDGLAQEGRDAYVKWAMANTVTEMRLRSEAVVEKKIATAKERQKKLDLELEALKKTRAHDGHGFAKEYQGGEAADAAITA